VAAAASAGGGNVIGLDEIDVLTGGRLGTFDTPCPLCSPFRRHRNQRIRVLRTWRVEPGFASFHCCHCGAAGYAHDRGATPPDPARLATARAEAAARDRAHKADRLGKARWLWSTAIGLADTIGERYLRDARGYRGPIPGTLRFLPARGDYAPAMVAAFGIPREVEPGVIAIAADAITGVHLTRLLPDGSDRERGDKAKIMVAHSTGSPIVLAPAGDMLGIIITEGIECALSAHEATGLGAWAAGAASRLPAIAEAVPPYMDCVTVIADDDGDGRKFAGELARGIHARGIEARQIIPAYGLRLAA
jgi:hypothetical protein